jgi:hypothetical protein
VQGAGWRGSTRLTARHRLTLHAPLRAGGELAERLEEDRESNNRVPQLLTVTISNQLPWAASQKPGATVQAAAGAARGVVWDQAGWQGGRLGASGGLAAALNAFFCVAS